MHILLKLGENMTFGIMYSDIIKESESNFVIIIYQIYTYVVPYTVPYS